MNFYTVIGLCLFIVLSGCKDSSAPKVEPQTNPVILAESTHQLVPKPFSSTGVVILVPASFNIPINDTIRQGEQYIRNTWKYVSSEDSASAVGISLGFADAFQDRHLKKFMDEMEIEARGLKSLRSLNTFNKRIDNHDFGVLVYTEWINGREVNCSALAAAVFKGNLLTLNIFFAGAVKKGYHQEVAQIIHSIKLDSTE